MVTQFIEIEMLSSFDKPQSLYFTNDMRNLLIFKLSLVCAFYLFI